MKVKDVSNEDGLLCAKLLNVLKIARFADISGSDVEDVMKVKAWVSSIATAMAEDLRANQNPPPVVGTSVAGTSAGAQGKPSASTAGAATSGLRIKGMGTTGTASKVKAKKRK